MAADTTDPHLALQAAALRLLRDIPTETAIEVVAEWIADLDYAGRLRIDAEVYRIDVANGMIPTPTRG